VKTRGISAIRDERQLARRLLAVGQSTTTAVHRIADARAGRGTRTSPKHIRSGCSAQSS
jgi:hypothetical protein